MDVKDILQNVAYLSSGADAPTEIDEVVYLRHLNTIHLELYRKTALYNSLIETNNEVLEAKDGIISPEFNYYSIIGNLYDQTHGNILQQLELLDLIKKDPILQSKGIPAYWCKYNKQIMIYPHPKVNTYINMWYKAAPNILALETKEKDIPYPPFFHQILVDGVFYYAMQGESGLRNKMELVTVATRWEKGIKDLMSYLTNVAGITYKSTYTKV